MNIGCLDLASKAGCTNKNSLHRRLVQTTQYAALILFYGLHFCIVCLAHKLMDGATLVQEPVY
jgi:hypothetical protein